MPASTSDSMQPRLIPYDRPVLPPDKGLRRALQFRADMASRRSVRMFSPDPVPREMIEHAIMTAASAPSGAHQQPWTFVAVSDPAMKHRIRVAAETEERRNYESRMSVEWLAALAPLGTDWHKDFLDVAPWLVVLFEQVHGWHRDGTVRKHYYVRESVGIACGLFVAAIHRMGLATLTHTPSPMGFLSRVLERPKNERPFVLLPVGYPAEGCVVPDLTRKPLDEVAVFVED